VTGVGTGAAEPSVTVVAGAVGGAGTTTVAAALATRTATSRGGALLVDLAPGRSDLAAMWGAVPERTFDDLRPVAHEVSPSHIRAVAHTHPSGVAVVFAPERWECEERWPVGALERVIGAAAAVAPVVIDAGTVGLPAAARACPVADLVVLVSSPTLHGTRRAAQALAALRTGCRGERVLVINRGAAGIHLRAGAVRRIAGDVRVVTLPPATREADAVLAGAGLPGRRSRIGAALAEVWAR
jgi:MinD-like ATPase involved in chromosome partitioning or flagellar assembly